MRQRLSARDLVVALYDTQVSDIPLTFHHVGDGRIDTDRRAFVQMTRDAAFRLECDVYEVRDELGVYTAGLRTATKEWRIGIAAVEPKVLPEDLLREGELADAIPWLCLVGDPEMQEGELVVEICSAPSPEGFPFIAAHKLGSSSAILWSRETVLRENARKASLEIETMVAKCTAGCKTHDGKFSVPLGRGIVGRLAENGTKVISGRLADFNPHNPRKIADEGWSTFVAAPIISAGQIIGVLSVYNHEYDERLLEEQARAIPSFAVEAVPYVRRMRKRNQDQLVQKLLQIRLDRLAVGLEVLGMAHDTAHTASRMRNRVHELYADSINKKLPRSALDSVILELKDTSDRVHAITRSMNRIVAGQKREIKPLEVLAQVDDMWASLTTLAPALEKDVKSGLWIRCAEVDFQRILLNVILNANHWANDKSPIVLMTADLFIDDLGIEYVEVSVTDNGPGMTIDQVAKAPTFMYTTRKDGLGLGLYVVKNLVSGMGGQMKILSDAGGERRVGTTVRLRIPSSGGKGA